MLLPYVNGKPTPSLFGTSDDNMHRALRLPIAPLFSMPAIIVLENRFDAALDMLFAQLDARFVRTSEVFDLGQWIQMFAFDAMGMLTFSEPYGFLESGQDIGGMMRSIWAHFSNTAPVSDPVLTARKSLLI